MLEKLFYEIENVKMRVKGVDYKMEDTEIIGKVYTYRIDPISVLNIGANNATCRLYNTFSTTGQTTARLFFVHIDVDTLFLDTPIRSQLNTISVTGLK